MKKLTARMMFVLLILILSAHFCPAVAQPHRGTAQNARVQAPTHPGQHPGNGGMPQVPPHIQQKMVEQQRQYQQQMEREHARQQQEAQNRYQNELSQFEGWLKANGGASLQGKASSLPKTPEAFDLWAATQKNRKAQGKSYDPLYDQFRSFAEAMSPRGAGARKGQAAKASTTQSAMGEHEKKSGKADAARKEAARAKRATVESEEKAKRTRAAEKRRLVQDQASVSLLRTVHVKLQEADRDYQGHRVRALHHVSEALHHLGSSAPAGLGSGSSLGNLPQAQSDEILRDSLQKLRNAEGQLGMQSSGAPHRSRARSALGQAVRELEFALRIR
jgi:hypothetical protein